MYLTIWHWISIFFFFGLFIVLVLVSSKESNQKTFLSLVFASFLVTLTAGIFSVFVLEKYTKKVELTKITHKRILRDDRIMFIGRVKNTGNYPLKKVYLEIKIVNNALKGGPTLKGSSLYKPSGFGSISSKKDSKKVTQINEKRVIALNVKPGLSKSFTIRFDYPGYFTKPYVKYTTYAH